MNISSGNISGFGTSAKQDTIIGHIDGVETLLTAIDSDTNDIKTAIQLLDNAVDGNFLNTNNCIAGVDVASSSGVKGSGTARVCIATNDIPIALVNTNLVALETSLTSMEGKQDDQETTLNACQVLLGTIDADTGAILTSVDGVEALLSTAVSRTSVNETTSRNLATTGSISQYTFDVGTSATFIKFYLSLGLNFPADGDMRVQVSADNSNWLFERLLVGTDFIDGSDYYFIVIELTNPPRYVRLYNNNGSAVITIVDGIIEYGRN